MQFAQTLFTICALATIAVAAPASITDVPTVTGTTTDAPTPISTEFDYIIWFGNSTWYSTSTNLAWVPQPVPSENTVIETLSDGSVTTEITPIETLPMIKRDEPPTTLVTVRLP